MHNGFDVETPSSPHDLAAMQHVASASKTWAPVLGIKVIKVSPHAMHVDSGGSSPNPSVEYARQIGSFPR